jgi:type IV pilus assembly protein PilM
VDEYYTIFKSLKLKPVALDVHSNAVEKLFINAVVNNKVIGEGAAILACVENNSLEMHLFSMGERAFTRISPLSSGELELILKNSGVHGGGENYFDDLDLMAENLQKDSIVTDAIRQYVAGLSDELNKMVQFQLRRESQTPVSSVFIYGSMSEVRGLAGQVSAQLGIRTEPVLQVSTINTGIRFNRYINAIGSLIRL